MMEAALETVSSLIASYVGYADSGRVNGISEVVTSSHRDLKTGIYAQLEDAGRRLVAIPWRSRSVN
jgi:hypothetical protein